MMRDSKIIGRRTRRPSPEAYGNEVVLLTSYTYDSDQSGRLSGECRLTLRCTVLTVPGAFSMAFVQASARQSSAGRPRRMTARISSRPSWIALETPGASSSRRRARLLAQEPLGLGRVALIPGLAQGLADARHQALVQPVCDVASLVHLATLDQSRVSEAPPDRLGERLGAVDDVEPRALGIETAIDQVVEQGLHRGRVLPPALGQTQHVFLAARIDANRRHHHVIADMKPVDPHHQKIQFVQRARQPGLQLRSRQRHEAARDRRLGTPVLRRRRQVTARVRRQTHRTAILAGRDTQHHQVHRPGVQQFGVGQRI